MAGKATVASRLVSAEAVCPARRLRGKDAVCQPRRRGCDPWVGEIPVQEEVANRLQCSGLGNPSHKSQTTEHTHHEDCL